eukprot:8757698-Pyramimonas_sp.AAC.1
MHDAHTTIVHHTIDTRRTHHHRHRVKSPPPPPPPLPMGPRNASGGGSGGRVWRVLVSWCRART